VASLVAAVRERHPDVVIGVGTFMITKTFTPESGVKVFAVMES
jgi:hypothetical protein